VATHCFPPTRPRGERHIIDNSTEISVDGLKSKFIPPPTPKGNPIRLFDKAGVPPPSRKPPEPPTATVDAIARQIPCVGIRRYRRVWILAGFDSLPLWHISNLPLAERIDACLSNTNTNHRQHEFAGARRTVGPEGEGEEGIWEGSVADEDGPEESRRPISSVVHTRHKRRFVKQCR
jgi:hypothetical protein